MFGIFDLLDWNNFVEPFFLDNFWTLEIPTVHVPNSEFVETKDGYELKLEIPGFKKEEIELELNGRTLYLRASHIEEKKVDNQEETKTEKTENIESNLENTQTTEVTQKKEAKIAPELYKYDSKHEYQASYLLPKNSNLESLNPVLENGLLTIKISTLPEDEPRKIEIH